MCLQSPTGIQVVRNDISTSAQWRPTHSRVWCRGPRLKPWLYLGRYIRLRAGRRLINIHSARVEPMNIHSTRVKLLLQKDAQRCRSLSQKMEYLRTSFASKHDLSRSGVDFLSRSTRKVNLSHENTRLWSSQAAILASRRRRLIDVQLRRWRKRNLIGHGKYFTAFVPLLLVRLLQLHRLTAPLQQNVTSPYLLLLLLLLLLFFFFFFFFSSSSSSYSSLLLLSLFLFLFFFFCSSLLLFLMLSTQVFFFYALSSCIDSPRLQQNIFKSFHLLAILSRTVLSVNSCRYSSCCS